MDIFVRCIPPLSTNRQLERCLHTPLKACGVQEYHVERMKNGSLANVTILDTTAGQRFLDLYGVPHGAPPYVKAARPLFMDGRLLKLHRSRDLPSNLSIRSLAYAASQQAASDDAMGRTQGREGASRDSPKFDISELQCGVWDYATSRLAFTPYYKLAQPGSITFGHKEAILLLGPTSSAHVRIDMNYHDCDHIVMGDSYDPTVSLTLRGIAPKLYHVHGEDVLSAGLMALVIDRHAARAKEIRKTRVTGIDDAHSKIAGVCFVYRLKLADPAMLGRVRGLLHGNPRKPPTINMPTSLSIPTQSWTRSKERLNHELTDTGRHGLKPFNLRFQIDRLARNGILPPTRVLELLPFIDRLHSKYGTETTCYALSRFNRQMPQAGPDVEAAQVSLHALEELLEDCCSYNEHAGNSPYELNKRHAHINLIHKVIVTPTGTYLEGPEPEPTNRVLRKYADQTDKFIRVLFQDEDGSSVRYDPRASQEIIYHIRFKGALNGTINIAGEGFSFLGFSHSSLRSQSCWFMAPVISLGLEYAPQVIKKLGDFSHIRTPAKCAARIGQAFTDTTASVSIHAGEQGSLGVVERNGRDFSDGVGTLSRALLESVWRVYGNRQQLKPTALQIRYKGAKGMVSLDSRLTGKRLLLRSNMEKFSGSDSQVLEICGAAFRPLPMVLNRQFIKILEDLGIATECFLQLQTHEVDKLRCMLTCAANTASLMETLELSKAPRVPELINSLDEIGFDYHKDHFLSGVVEMAVVSRLRDIKYRGRITVDQGVTLYGIMDETGFLQDGEVYVVTEKGPEGGRREMIRNRVVITRSPALHPGDVQIVNAVSVPGNSPLKQLSNVVVFSQHGARDLPSQLSGGDLDGDIYNVIWDERLVPQQAFEAADYTKVVPLELDRDVTPQDMSDFFVTFMETDQLGMLCNIHMQLADQLNDGTFSPECIQLAQMASTAVDYSKTGIPIDIKECPKYDRCRPDFMSPSPRMVVSDQGYMDLEEADDGDDEAFEGLDTERRPYRYYESQKALGHLYRAIDERQFLTSIKSRHGPLTSPGGTPSTILPDLLKHVLRYAHTNLVQYSHALDHAREVRQSYDESLLAIMYDQCPVSHACLAEQEVFAGTILGRQGGAQGKPLRELSKVMRERFEQVAEYAVQRIIKGDQTEVMQGVIAAAAGLLEEQEKYDEREIEAFPRSIACLQVAVLERGWNDRQAGELKSFGYIAAGVCLREWRRFLITTFGVRSLPRV
ncbi:hypothetical protein LTR53_002958 [Teratosphaeriaceae sp. CCFEE 6253]|nr:hypothetical protein LTR53_002958 [Teratosphaeriaceae sp. CCFEE 6253]